MISSRWIALLAATTLVSSAAFAQLGKGKPGGGGGPSQGPSSSPPPKNDTKPNPPPRQEPPPRQNPPPRQEQPPTKNPPPRQEQPPTKNPPPRQEQPPTKNPPPRQEQPPTKNPPPRQEQPPTKNPPPRQEQGPPQGPPRGNPPVRGSQGAPPRNDRDENYPSRGQLGKIDRNENGQNNSSKFTRSNEQYKNANGRSYNGQVSNLTSKGGSRSAIQTKIDRVPPEIRSGSLQHQVDRESNVRARRVRSGYYHYNPNWCDDWFWYSSYVFDPFRYRCVVSPWYYYYSLPGYINHSNVIVLNLGYSDPWRGSSYSYRRADYSGYYQYRRSELDYAIDDLVEAFEQGDRRSLSRLMPRNERVDIYLEGQYDYSLNADQFYDLMLDAIYNTDTRRYEITKVETWRDQAEVVARHDYVDPWGRWSSVYHWYRLEENRRGYVITKFGTSNNRW